MGQPINWCPATGCRFAMNLTREGWVCPNQENHPKLRLSMTKPPANVLPCAVCEAPVEIANTHMEVHIDREQYNAGNKAISSIAICHKERCQRLLNEVLEELGREKIRID